MTLKWFLKNDAERSIKIAIILIYTVLDVEWLFLVLVKYILKEKKIYEEWIVEMMVMVMALGQTCWNNKEYLITRLVYQLRKNL
jgi:NADH:ubiquinone oxidoreductase subunit 3 (subunit A)